MTTVLIVIGSILVFQNLIYYFMLAMELRDSNLIFMHYKQFRSLYQIAPEKYELYNYNEVVPGVRYPKGVEHPYYIYFYSIPEWILVKHMFHAEERMENRARRMRNKTDYLQMAKDDLANFVMGEEKRKRGLVEFYERYYAMPLLRGRSGSDQTEPEERNG